MSQQDASKTRPYRWLVLDTRALASLTVSKLGYAKLIFIEPGAKINGQCYRDVLLMQKLLSAMRSIAEDVFVFQQDNASAHRARNRVELLCRKTPHFISSDMWPANSPDLNPVDYCVWGMLQERVHVSSTNPQYRRVAEASCCDMGWISAERGGLYAVLFSREKILEVCIHAEGGHFEHLLWRCKPDIPVVTHHNRFFSEPPMFGGTQHYLQSDEEVLHFTG